MAVKLGYKNVYRDPYGYPEWQGKGLPVESKPAGLSEGTAPPKAPGPLYGWAMVWTLLGIFVGGIALNLTPCVYPLIPITVSYFGGGAAQGQGRLWSMVFFTWRAYLDQLHPGGDRRLNRRTDGGHASEPHGPDHRGGDPGLFCHQPFGVLGDAPAEGLTGWPPSLIPAISAPCLWG